MDELEFCTDLEELTAREQVEHMKATQEMHRLMEQRLETIVSEEHRRRDVALELCEEVLARAAGGAVPAGALGVGLGVGRGVGFGVGRGVGLGVGREIGRAHV